MRASHGEDEPLGGGEAFSEIHTPESPKSLGFDPIEE